MMITAFITVQSMSAQTCTITSGGNKTSCCGGYSVNVSVTASTSCTGLSYVWMPSASVSNPNIANPMVFPTSTTVYTICAIGYSAPTCSNVCCSACTTLTVTVNGSCCRLMNPGEPGKHSLEGISAYPNPTRNIITIETTQPLLSGELIMTDIMGNVIWTKTLEKGKQSLDVDVSTLAKGIYLIKGVSEKDGEIYSNKIVLE